MLQGGHAGFPPQQVAQVVGRKTELVGTVLYSRQAFGSQSIGMEIVVQQGFKTGKYVAIQILAGDELAVVEADAVIQQKLDIIHDERFAVFVKDRTLQLLADVLHAADEDLPLRRGKPEEGKVITLSGKTEGLPVPMDVFMEYTKIPIIIYYGDNLPETNERPEIYEWTRRLHLMRRWADMLNKLGGDVTVVHLPEAGLHGNTHFPMSDLNNAEVAELMAKWLHEKGLD